MVYKSTTSYITSHPVVKRQFCNIKIVKMGCKEDLNLNSKPGCLRLVSALQTGPCRQVPVKLSVMLLLIPEMDLVLSSGPYS